MPGEIRPASAEEVAAFAAAYQAPWVHPQAEATRREWCDPSAVRASLADGRQYHICYTAGVAVCALAITPGDTAVEIEAPIIRYLGRLGAVPRHLLGPGPLRIRSHPDRLHEFSDLHPAPLMQVYSRGLDDAPVTPGGVQVHDSAPESVRPLWRRLWAEHEMQRGARVSLDALREHADRELALAGARWFTVEDGGLVAAARSGVTANYVTLTGAYVLPQHRRRGCGAALIRARLADGFARGFRLAAAQASDHQSCRNLERENFAAVVAVYLIP